MKYSLVFFVVLMFSINVGLGLFNHAVSSYNDDYEGMIDFSNSPAAAYTNGSLTTGFNANSDDVLPESSDSVDPDTGNVFTDAWKSVTNWWNKQQTRFSLLTSIFSQPYGFLKDIGIPQEYATAFAMLWYSIMGILLVAFIRSGGGT